MDQPLYYISISTLKGQSQDICFSSFGPKTSLQGPWGAN